MRYVADAQRCVGAVQKFNDECLGCVGDAQRFTLDAQRCVDECLRYVGAVQRFNNEALRWVDEAPRITNEAQSMASEGLSFANQEMLTNDRIRLCRTGVSFMLLRCWFFLCRRDQLTSSA